MSNKEYLIQILLKLSSVRQPAKGLIVMLKKNKLSINMIDEITTKLSGHIKDIRTQEEEAKLKMGISTIQLIKLREQQNRNLDDEDLGKIESILGI